MVWLWAVMEDLCLVTRIEVLAAHDALTVFRRCALARKRWKRRQFVTRHCT